jgi:RimJ/RimL family protein N-acetyltransferase
MTIAEALRHPPADGELALEPLGEEHRAALKVACAEDEAIWPIYAVSFAPAQFDATFDALLANPMRIPFAVLLGGALAGMSAYLDPDEARQVVEIGNTYLRPALRGTGLNARLKRLMLRHAFASGVRRVELRVDDRNARSKAAVAKIGGVYEGLLRADRITWTGHVRDSALFSILKDEWTA